MKVYRQRYTRKDKAGNKVTGTTSRWYVRFKDHTGTWRALAGYTDHDLTESLGRKCEKLAGHRANRDPLTDDLRLWIDSLADDTRTKLIAWGLIDARHAFASMSLSQHLEDWRDSILNDDRTNQHAEQHYTRAKNVVDGCKFRRFADIDAEQVKGWIARQPFSQSTKNYYRRACKQFTRWMRASGRAVSNPLADLGMIKVTQRARERRALRPDELAKFLKAAPAERELIYRTAIESGLRASEMRSLTAASFDLDADPPRVTIRSAYAKNGKQATLSVSMELAAKLRDHLANKLPAAKAFAIRKRTAEMVRKDLEAAGLEYQTEAGIFDFHSLRVQTATLLAEAGVHPAVAQRRMRHGTVGLTIDTYTRLGYEATDQAIPSVGA